MSAGRIFPEPDECAGLGVEIAPRAEALGGGWRVRLVECGQVQKSLIFGAEAGELGRALEVAASWVAGERDSVEILIDDDRLSVRRLEAGRDIFDPFRRASE